MKLPQAAVDALDHLASAQGWEVTWKTAPRRADAILRAGGQAWCVELKARPDTRGAQLESALAAAALEAGRHAEPGERALPVVFAPRLTTRMVERLRAYAARYVEPVAWLLLDADGLAVSPALGLNLTAESARPRRRHRNTRARPGSPTTPTPFSDLGQWLTKVALAAEIPERLLHAPRARLISQTDLAARAEVSLATVNRWVHGLEALGLLSPEGRSFRPGPTRTLLRAWSRAAHAKPIRELPCVAFAQQKTDKLTARIQSRLSSAILARYSACRALGLGVVEGALPALYMNELSEPELDILGLRPARMGEQPDLTLIVPAYPESVARAAVDTPHGRCADVLQCYLDVVDHPTRGREQAEVILAHLEEALSW